MKLKLLTLFSLGMCCTAATAIGQSLVIQAGGSITTTAGSSIVVQGSVKGDGPITGPGTLVMAGSSASTLDMAGNNVPNLQIDNTAGVTMLSAARVTEGVQFTNGKLTLGNNNLTLDDNSTVIGGAAGKFFETNGTGEVQKLVTGNLTNFAIPVGVGANYRPIELTTSGTYASAKLGVRNANGAAASKPVSTDSHLTTSWPITSTGITGTVTAKGTYVDPSDVTGTEANIRGYYHNGTAWSSASGTNDGTLNTVSAPITAASGVLTGINKFVLANAKAYLAGAMINLTVPGTLSTMRDDLRINNLIPLNSPYLNPAFPEYNISHFNRVNNNLIENTNSTVLGVVDPNNSIVDWVFLELRNTANPSNAVQATRSALIQRDGDIVDVDGLSPVTFNSLANGNYVIGIKHRNHLPMYTDLGINVPTFNESPSALVNMTSRPDSEMFGSFITASSNPYRSVAGVNYLYPGNARTSVAVTTERVRYISGENDSGAVLSKLLALGLTAASNSSFIYAKEDLNMNGRVRYISSANDTGVVLQSLDNAGGLTRNAQIPN